MSNETQTSEASAPENQVAQPPLPNVAIKRNEIELPLARFKIVKGARKTKEYLAPSITMENLQKVLEWYGVKEVIKVLQKDAKANFQSIFFDALDEKGFWSEERFIREATTFTQAGQKKADLERELDEAQGRQLDLMQDGLDPATGTFKPDVAKKMIEVSEEIRALRALLDEKSRKNKPEEEPQPAVQVV